MNFIINWLKAIAIIMVVLDHAIIFGFEHCGYCDFLFLKKYIQYLHNPLFFFISGYLCHKQDIYSFVYKKIYRILIPFLFFSLLKLLYSNFITSNFLHFSSLSEQLFDAFVNGSLYWFAYAIFAATIFSMSFWIVNDENKRKILLFATIVILLFLNNSRYAKMIPQYFQMQKMIHILPFYLIGMISALFKLENIKNRSTIISIFLGIWICFVLDIVSINNNYWLRFLYSVSSIVLVASLVKMCAKKNIIMTTIAKYTWQIMLLDSFYKTVLFFVVSKIFGINMISILFIVTLDIVLSVSTCLVVEKIPYLNFLFGLKNTSSNVSD